MRGTYLERLAARTAVTGTTLCLGLDPDPAALPAGFSRDVVGIERFAAIVLDAALPYVSAVKPNVAFYEAFGSQGIAALERLRATIPADVPVIMDAKRADIGTTAARQAVALFDALGADAVTVNPYLGEAAIEALLERVDRFAYVVCRTSNPGASELQDLPVAAQDGAPAERLHERVARRVATWGPGGTVGIVVGATGPAEMAGLRATVPGLAFLVPGLGAQGGDVEAVCASGPAATGPVAARPGGGLVVNVSRAISAAALPDGVGDLEEAIAGAVRDWAERLPVLP